MNEVLYSVTFVNKSHGADKETHVAVGPLYTKYAYAIERVAEVAGCKIGALRTRNFVDVTHCYSPNRPGDKWLITTHVGVQK